MERLIDELSQVQCVESFTLEFSRPPVAARERLDESTWAVVQSLTPTALTIRNEYGVPFWSAVLQAAVQAGVADSALAVVDAATYHNEAATAPRRELARAALHELADLIDEHDGIISLLSECRTPDGVAHVPMVDFRLPAEDGNDVVAMKIASQLGSPGFVLASGKSYHFIGVVPLPFTEFVAFLGRASLYAPLVDQRWVAHQLIEGRAALRVSRHPAGFARRFVGDV